uniref:type I polyketide synthase n=1 Tax=Haliangium sp. TaxID=2663208 RepID=UPI003D106197
MNQDTAHRAIAVVGVGAVMPDAPDAETFWQNIQSGRYSISDVPPGRWDPNLYYDPDPKAPEKTYSRIGGWVKEAPWKPLEWKLPIPPRVAQALDRTQRWAIAAVREALTDYGKELDSERTAVILGNAMAGDQHYMTALRVFFPEFAEELSRAPSFATLSEDVRRAIVAETHSGVRARFPEITEDTMPGELANVIAGRIASLFNLHGPNYICDAACASAMAAITAAIEGLDEHDYDAVITGGVDGNMSASSFVKFCKIGALSATGTRPYADGADGFVMGEGAAIFVLKRLADAERDGDRILAVLRATGGSSDGKGKGITAPNPVGQRLAIERAWRNAGLSPATCTMLEGHGTSTRVGDVVEVNSAIEVFEHFDIPVGSVALGSVKSNIGHLKGAAGAAGVFKAVMALRDKMLPPSLGFARPNPKINFGRAPFAVNTELRPWEHTVGGIRRAGVSAFGFGGTNFHAVLEEYVPGRVAAESGAKVSVSRGRRSASHAHEWAGSPHAATLEVGAGGEGKAPLRGALVIGGANEVEVSEKLAAVQKNAAAGRAPTPEPPSEADLHATVRLAIDYGNAAELAGKAERAIKALASGHAGMWKALRAQGVFLGRGPAAKVAFLYTGQGSQYVNMLSELCRTERVVAEVFEEADRVMTPLLEGRPLTDILFASAERQAQAEEELRQTEITQPAVLTVDAALTRLLGAYGIVPDMVMGHSLGEYGALVAAGVMSFDDALLAVSARGKEMTRVSMADNGAMVAVFGPLREVERILREIDGYVVVANLNSNNQAVVGGATEAVRKASEAFLQAGFRAVPLPVSHAFHTKIVAPASGPLMTLLRRLEIQPPAIPLVANVTGSFYPTGAGVEDEIVDILGRQIASPVQFVKGLNALYEAGARVFVEVGPKKALAGMAEDVLGDRPGVLPLFTNHPKVGDATSFNQALCGLYAAGLGAGKETRMKAMSGQGASPSVPAVRAPQTPAARAPAAPMMMTTPTAPTMSPAAAMMSPAAAGGDRYQALGQLFAEFLERGMALYQGRPAPGGGGDVPVVVSGVGLGLPGTDHVFDDANVDLLLRGGQFIDAVPMAVRKSIVDKHVTRLVKSATGTPRFEVIDSATEVIKLAGRPGAFDLVEEFGVPADRVPVLDITTRLAIAVGVQALRDAGIPLVMRYKTTTKGTKLPERWMLPEPLRDDTGVIFGAAFPGYDNMAEEMAGYYEDRIRRERLAELESLRGRTRDPELIKEIDRRVQNLRADIERNPYVLDRKYLFKVLSMGHSQFAEYIGARGPNTQINAACASGTQAVGLAQDWIRAGRCRRVVIVTSDAVTTDRLLEWIGAGFLASGAAATDELVEDAAVPFDRRRHGLILGMGASGMVIESAAAAAERGVRPITEVLATATANSAFHGSRLDVNHICQVMERLVAEAEAKYGISRAQIAAETVFMSHETYTPARGGSAQAEVFALRSVFGDAADQIVVANTKGYTGHAMGAGVEDAVVTKILETGVVPPVPNHKELDPELGRINLSQGGSYPVRYALRLGAGFGSQIAMSLTRWVPTPDGTRAAPHALGYEYRISDVDTWQRWLDQVSGYDAAHVEVVQNTLRIKDQGAPARVPAQPSPVAPALPAPAPYTAAPVAPAPAPYAPAPAPRPAPVAAPVAAPAPAPAPAAAPAPAPVAAAPAGPDPVESKVLEIVSAQTGYPPDMLDLELDLEADLGIDTVKQAETFAAVREAYAIERDENLQLRDFPTLKDVIGWVHDKRPDLAVAAASAVAPAAPAAPAAAPPAAGADPVQAKVLEIVSAQTGYPPDMLDLELDLEADLGIDTVKQAETFAAVREAY